MRRASLALAVLVLLSAGSLRADVAPFPSWRLAANGTIARAVQAGSAIYVAGNFTKIGRAVPAFSATLDPATLTFVPRTGCAQQGPSLLPGRHSTLTTGLVDGNGPYVVPPGTAVVRIGSDCRFDRRFRVMAPPTGLFFPNGFVELGGRVYLNVETAPGYPISQANSARWILEVDGVSGQELRYWPADSGDLVLVVGVTGDGRLLAQSGPSNSTSTSIGVFDPDSGQFAPMYTTSGDWGVVHAGAAIAIYRSSFPDYEVRALDANSMTPLANWPVVRVDARPVFTSANGRLFVSSSQLSIDGVTASRLAAFDTTTGALLGGFTAPAWVHDPSTVISSLAVATGRVIAIGDFAPGAPRDTAAAFDVTTGALDPWVQPYVLSSVFANSGLLYFPTVDARDRVTRTTLVAVDAATGAPLPWSASTLPPTPFFGRYALAADAAGGQLYVGSTGSVRRYDLATGQLDTTWTLDTANPTSGFNQVSDLALLGSTLYMTGSFSQVRDNPAGPWQSREGGAAITTTGALTAWQPQVQGNCFFNVRPVGISFPCVSQLVALPNHLVMQGAVRPLQPSGEAARSVMSFTADTGVDDGFLPAVPAGVVGGLATDGLALFANAQLPGPTLVRVDDASGARVVGPIGLNAFGATTPLAVHGGRVYADRERDLATAAPTGNSMMWTTALAASTGVIDLVNDRLAFHADAAGVAPRAPANLSAVLDANTVRLQWSPGAGDLAPLVWPPAPGGTAATSHIVLASLTPGGAPAAQIDTASADTTFSIAAPTGTFYVRVQAKNAFGTSALSAELRVDVQPQAPNPPLATIASVSGRTVHFEWQAPSLGWAATSYLLDAGTAPGLSNIGTLPVNGTTFDAPVPPGRYYVRIRAVNATGASVPGDEVIIDVP